MRSLQQLLTAVVALIGGANAERGTSAGDTDLLMIEAADKLADCYVDTTGDVFFLVEHESTGALSVIAPPVDGLRRSVAVLSTDFNKPMTDIFGSDDEKEELYVSASAYETAMTSAIALKKLRGFAMKLTALPAGTTHRSRFVLGVDATSHNLAAKSDEVWTALTGSVNGASDFFAVANSAATGDDRSAQLPMLVPGRANGCPLAVKETFRAMPEFATLEAERVG